MTKYFECDRCASKQEDNEGWEYQGGRDLCPKCAILYKKVIPQLQRKFEDGVDKFFNNK